MNHQRLYASLVSDSILRCLAFGHAFVHPDQWNGWTRLPGGLIQRLRTHCFCENECGTRQTVILTIRVSSRGNLLEVISRRSRLRYSDQSYATMAPPPGGQRPPSRDDYRFEFLSRQQALRRSLGD